MAQENREERKREAARLIARYLDHWTEDYRSTIPLSKCAGIMLADLFEWDGIAILQAAQAALEDSNFHPESAIVEELIKLNSRNNR